MDKVETIKSIINEILAHMGVKTQVEIKAKEPVSFEIEMQGDNLNFLIGYRGQSLDALQDLLSHIYFKKTNEWPDILLDINGYTKERIERIQNIAKKFNDRVRFFQNEVELPIMNPWERKHVHTLVGEYDDVESESRGDGRNRRLYLKPKKRGD